MSRATAIPLAFFVAVLAIGGALLAGLDSDATEDAATAASMEARIAALEQEVGALRSQVATLRSDAPRRLGPGPAAMALREGAGYPIDVRPSRALEAAEVDGQEVLRELVDSDDPATREKFSELVRGEMDQAREERWERRQERRAERRQRRLEQLSTDFGLGSDQLAALQMMLEDEQEQLDDLFRSAREELSFDQARSKAGELRGTTDREARELLDDEQYAAWQEMREEERGGRGR